MSPERIRSPCFACFKHLCHPLGHIWLHRSEETLWLLVQQDKKGMSEVFESCLASLCISPLFIESVFQNWVWNSVYSLLPWTETVQSKQNLHHFCFHHLASEKITWDWVLFSSSAILKPALQHTTNRKATNSSGSLPGPPPCFISLLPSRTWAARSGLLLLDQTTCATTLTPSKPRLA